MENKLCLHHQHHTITNQAVIRITGKLAVQKTVTQKRAGLKLMTSRAKSSAMNVRQNKS